MKIIFEKLDSKFRELTDLLFFSDRMDLDLSDYKSLLQKNQEMNLEYLKSRFCKSTDIFWQNGALFWNNRLSFLFSLNDKGLTSFISKYLEKKLLQLIKFKYDLSIEYDLELIQFLEFCKVKRARNESLNFVKKHFINMPSYTRVDKMIKLVNVFIPALYNDINEYIYLITRKLSSSTRNFDFLEALEKNGLVFDKSPIIDLAIEILNEKLYGMKYRRAFMFAINDPIVLQQVKLKYNSSLRANLLDLFYECNFREMEDHHLRNFKNLIKLDPLIVEEITTTYANTLYSRPVMHKRANVDRLVKLIKYIPEVKAKSILVYLSSHNQINDVKYLISSFPELSKLALFI